MGLMAKATGMARSLQSVWTTLQSTVESRPVTSAVAGFIVAQLAGLGVLSAEAAGLVAPTVSQAIGTVVGIGLLWLFAYALLQVGGSLRQTASEA